ncbi:MAG TPA: WhiB family transcriptional regulator [Dermatophilaceae bacterium]|nr:WhiB family transcriptional regulator [Dermatophilaceae bacterium]
MPRWSSPEPIPCQGVGTELWFAETPADVEFATPLCSTCPVRRGCLEGALRRREPCGVWGGELLVQGMVARKRPRGRPREALRWTVAWRPLVPCHK